MAKIPAIIWIIIGALTVFFSFRAGDDLILFFYGGLIFIGIGVAKLLLNFVFRKKVSKAVQKHLPKAHLRPHFCPNCRNPIHPKDRFCKRCGRRLR